MLQADDQIRAGYEQLMAEWLGCEAIVRQREKESHAAALAKCSSGASLDTHIQRMMHRDSTVSNEVSRLRACRVSPPSALRGKRASFPWYFTVGPFAILSPALPLCLSPFLLLPKHCSQ